MATSQNNINCISTGILRLDEILKGGLPKGEICVVNGEPGAGKTILALHFLAAGVQAGEKVLFITLSQRVASVKQSAHSVGIDTTNIEFHELSRVNLLQDITEQQSVFDTSQQQLDKTIRAFTQAIEEIRPARLVFDSISYLRMLASSPLAYRRQLLALRDFLLDRRITTILTDTQELAPGNQELSAIAHGVITLSQELTPYRIEHRYLQISKIRGSSYQSGKHNVTISDQGMQVYPQLVQIKSPQREDPVLVNSGVKELDQMLGGGLLTGTSCLIVGPSGTGKTSLATLLARHFVSQKQGKASFFLFDELIYTFKRRSAGIGLDVENLIAQDQMRFCELGLGDLTLGQFSELVRQDVLEWGAKIIVIDTLTGYLNAIPSERALIAQMHELLIFLNSHNVLSFLVVAQHGILGNDLEVPVDVSYLSDMVLMLRHFEAEGGLRQAISINKKRYGYHERQIRELRVDSQGIRLGEPLSEFRGILSGTPEYVGSPEHLIKDHE
jgi:circadian clock protein KaiC